MNVIEYFYSAHSAYAYIGHARLLEICAERGCELVHRPIDLREVLKSARISNFRVLTPHYRDYFFGREIERWAEFRSVDILNYRPTHHDNKLDLSNGLLISAILDGRNIDKLSHAILKSHWLDDIDLANVEDLRRVIGKFDSTLEPILELAMSEKVQKVHKENTAEAIKRGVFGSPTYFLNGDMYYGQDHLELMLNAFDQPYKSPKFYNPPQLEKPV